jgi:flagellar basal-body rod modification protein FlgD
MTSPLSVTTPGATTPTSSTSSSTSTSDTSDILGKDDFLQLLVTQLKNQDPLSPLDATQFAAQLAQFSTVEQLVDMNSKLDAQTSAASQSQIAQQASFATSIIGRDVILNGATVTAVDGTGPRVNVDLSGAATTVHVDILDSDGTTVIGSQDFQNVGAGSQTLTLKTGLVSPGTYSYNVSAVDGSGQPITVTGNTIGQVDSTLFQAGQVMVRVDGTAVPVTDITEILPAETTSAPATTH